ncbi:CYTH and CHAD domain-containing protein [Amaricoccus solimangrovi]|uniref:CHAD domain-containing protein n=1 Tax=Amaricoccus solimangrovi TaxID=2589815 RepID=A0A501WRA5_9RHOB|nr:CYTH and CHAD domain-containing protein [Amaricoccus solimangrovi]TPE48296.1 CHAD domain-containing protein [Amaricoccus solimangrovi]
MATEVELKLTLDPGAEARLRRDPALETRTCPGRTANLVSIYYDTPDEALARAGIALRLRREGRRWIQTIKRRTGDDVAGLFANEEVECPAPGARLVLEGKDPAFAAVTGAAGGAPLSPMFETRVKRRIEVLGMPEGVVELGIDQGEIVAGSRVEPILEAELELKEGAVAAVYTAARRLFHSGPIRFAKLNKSARGYALARGEDDAAARKKPAAPDFSAKSGAEKVARDILRDCFAQITREQERLADETAPEGAHQLRVGLRRLRTALKLFEPVLGTGGEGARLSETARTLGQAISPLRDLDVLEEEIGELVESGLDAPARDALVAAISERREQERARARAAMAGPEGVRFLFDLGQFIETRGWLVPSDYDQTARLAQPVGEVAGQMLGKRLKAARKRAKHLEHLDEHELHDLRKALKKLRYGVEMLAPIYGGREVSHYVRAIKDLQDKFGSLTDAAMARGWLTGEAALGATDPAAQRAAGWLLGTMTARVVADRPRIFAFWKELAGRDPFWRG